MKFIINPNETKTSDEPFKLVSTKLRVKPFISDIKGLVMILENANGSSTKIPIPDTNTIKEEKIYGSGYMRFEYLLSDKKYIIEVEEI
jgi:hypothetical protein